MLSLYAEQNIFVMIFCFGLGMKIYMLMATYTTIRNSLMRCYNMERLTKRNEQGTAYLAKVKLDEQEVGCNSADTLRCIVDVFQKLADYDDAEQQGRLAVLPCKIDDIVYLALEDGSIKPFRVTQINSNRYAEFSISAECLNQHEDCCCADNVACGIMFPSDNMNGSNVYSTREEAEAEAGNGKDG
jgi:hypothetical protein